MGRPIDADALEREGWSLCRTFQKDKDTMVYEAKKPSDFPTIEERKNGTWIYGENKYGHDGWQCDQCGHWILWDYHVSMEDAERDLSKYCPNCGADMRGTP